MSSELEKVYDRGVQGLLYPKNKKTAVFN